MRSLDIASTGMLAQQRNVEVISTTFKGYPSLEAFRARWRLMRSYELMIADEVTEEELQKHAERTARFFTEGTTTVDVIPFLARSLQTGAWEVNGMEKAKERAEAALKRIQDGAKFDEVLTAEGEFFQNDKDRGRLANKGYNPMRQAVRETEFTDLLMGYSLGAYLFYDAPVGEMGRYPAAGGLDFGQFGHGGRPGWTRVENRAGRGGRASSGPPWY